MVTITGPTFITQTRIGSGPTHRPGRPSGFGPRPSGFGPSHVNSITSLPPETTTSVDTTDFTSTQRSSSLSDSGSNAASDISTVAPTSETVPASPSLPASLSKGVSTTPSPSSASNVPGVSIPPSQSSGINTGGKVGIALGGLVLLAAFTIGILLWRRKRRTTASVSINGHTLNTRLDPSRSELSRGHLLPYVIPAFLTPRTRERGSKEKNRLSAPISAPTQEEKSAIANALLDELTFARSPSNHTDHLSPENMHLSNIAHAQDPNQTAILPELRQDTLPEVKLTASTTIPSAAPLNVPPPNSQSPTIQRRRQSIDGGVHLAGGPPGQSDEDSEDVDDASTLPPAYGTY